MRARLVTAAAVATATMLPAFLALGAAPASASAKGDVKIAEVGAPASHGNDPQISSCSFDLQWYNFAKLTNVTVGFKAKEPTGDARLTLVAGPTSVKLPEADRDTGLNTVRTYTVSFSGGAPATNGSHVEPVMSANGKAVNGHNFWVKCGAATTDPGTTDPDPSTPAQTDPGTGGGTTDPGTGGGTTDPGTGGGTTDPGTGDDTTDPGTGDDTTDPGTGDDTTDPGTGDDTTDPGTGDDPVPPFSWDWQYATPTCDALTVDYPSNIPAGQANDVNVRFQTAQGAMTLNFHNDSGTWSGTHVFDFTTHPRWPAGLSTYHVVWAQVGGTNYHWNGDVACAPVPVVEPDAPFSWDWKYADPTCTALTAAYPSNIPENQASDANIRFESNIGEFTLNYHNNDGTWSGNHVFDYLSHPRWPAGVTSFHVVWTQVGGTNYHWQGDVSCVLEGGVAKAATAVQGFRTGNLTVGRGSSVATDSVAVDGSGFQDLVLQTLSGSGRGTAARSAATWTTVRAISVASDGTARVTFPKLKKKGTYKFRLAVAGSGISTGDTTGTLTVRVR